jgi:hypothetical protein
LKRDYDSSLRCIRGAVRNTELVFGRSIRWWLDDDVQDSQWWWIAYRPLPLRSVENEYLGEARDTVVETARSMAESTAQQIVGENNAEGGRQGS